MAAAAGTDGKQWIGGISRDGYAFCTSLDAAIGTRARPPKAGRGAREEQAGVRGSLGVIGDAARTSQVLRGQVAEEEAAIERCDTWLRGMRQQGGASRQKLAFSTARAGGEASGRQGWRGGGLRVEAREEGCYGPGSHLVVRVGQEGRGGDFAYASHPAGPGEWAGRICVSCPRDMAERARCAGDVVVTPWLVLAPRRGRQGGGFEGVVVPLGGGRRVDAFELGRGEAGGAAFAPRVERLGLGGGRAGAVGKGGKFSWMIPRGLGSGSVREALAGLGGGDGEGGAVAARVGVQDDVVVRAGGGQHVCSVVELRCGGARQGGGGGEEAAVMVWARASLCRKMAAWMGDGEGRGGGGWGGRIGERQGERGLVGEWEEAAAVQLAKLREVRRPSQLANHFSSCCPPLAALASL